jgi:hypothetical protein
MRAYWENVVNEGAREGVNMYAMPAAPRERGAGISSFLNSESNTASSSSSSISNHPEDWHVNIDGVWIYNPALARARHAAAARLFNDALPQTSSLAQMVQTTINDRPPTTINDRPPTTINDKPPTTLNNAPPVEPPQTTEAMPAFGYDNSMDVNHWLEQTRDYIIWQLRLNGFYLHKPKTNRISTEELLHYLFAILGIKTEKPETDEMDRLTQQFKNLNIGHAGRIPQMHPSSRVYESAAAQFAYPQVPKKWEDLKPHARMPRRKPKQEPRRRSRSPSNLREN